MKFAFIIDPIARLDPGHDSSVALMEAAQQLGHEVWITQANQLGVVNGKAIGLLQQVSLTPVELVNGLWVAANPWFTVSEAVLRPLEEMDAVFMRTDPPVNVPYLYATYILDYIDPSKTRVINSPSGIRAANEKMYALQFTEAIPETIVSQDKTVIREFLERKGSRRAEASGRQGGRGDSVSRSKRSQLQFSDRNQHGSGAGSGDGADLLTGSEGGR